MSNPAPKHRILILGASGFLGDTLYKELCQYFKTFGTYCTERASFESNKHFFQYDMSCDDLLPILKDIRPTVVISALRGPFAQQVFAHECLASYSLESKCRIVFLSSANVFDAYSQYPSYEYDKTLSNSIYGHFKIKIENILMRLPEKQWVIARLPMVFGLQSPRLTEIKEHLINDVPVEVFPNLIVNITTDQKLSQQIHYIINQNLTGIFHLGSTYLVHHEYFFKDILKALQQPEGRIKYVYTTNDDRFLAVLPKKNKLPEHLQFQTQQFLEEIEVQQNLSQ